MRAKTVHSRFQLHPPVIHRKGQKMMAGLLTLLVLCTTSLSLEPALAAKKKKGGDSELQKVLEPMTKTIDDLLAKVQSHYLFSAKDNDALVTLKYQVLDIIKDNPTNPLVMKPVYQTAVIYNKREQFIDAYDLFTFISANFPDTPYGQRAKGEITKMKKQLGEDYFPVDTPTPPADPPKK